MNGWVSGSELGPLGPILGNESCAHESVRYFNGIEGVYGVCARCGGHFWYAVVPDGAEVTDLNFDEAPEDDDEAQQEGQ